MEKLLNTYKRDKEQLLKLVAVFLMFVFFAAPLAPVFAFDDFSDSDPIFTDSLDTDIVEQSDIADNYSQDEVFSDVEPDISPESNPDDAVSAVDEFKEDILTDIINEEDNEISPEGETNAIGESPSDTSSLSNSLTSQKQLIPELDPATGALVYNYSITVPPGRNGMQPDLKLQYNSQDSVQGSVFGYGWTLNIPYIQRLNKSGSDKLYDPSFPNYFYSSLDGELVNYSGSSYVPKIENGSFNKYVFSENKWLVTTKDGAEYKFGYNTSSQQNNSASPSDTYKWMLQEVRDTNGNYISYLYFKDAGQIYPLSIKYTNNGAAEGIFKVSFQRIARTDNAVSHATGFAVNSNYLINEINVRANNDWVRKYILSYEKSQDTNRSLLKSITMSGKNNIGNIISLPETSFDYQSSSVTNWIPADTYWNFPNPASDFQVSAGNNLESYSPDLNADGLPDLVTLIARFRVEGDIYQYKRDAEFLNTGHGWTPQLNEWKLPGSSSWGLPSYFFDEFGVCDCGLGEVYFPDLNADGLPDLVERVGVDGYPPDDLNNTFTNHIYINNGHGWSQANPSWKLPDIPSGLYPINPWSWQKYFVDLNGDGLSDFIQIIKVDAEPDNSSPYFEFKEFVYINNGSGWTEANSSWNLKPMNFWLNNWHAGNSTVIDLKFPDLNGDGLADMVISHKGDILPNGPEYPGGENSDIYINNGSGWTQAGSEWNFPKPQDSSILKSQIVDFNNDGFPDLVENFYLNNTNQRIGYINNGNGWNLPYIFFGYTNDKWVLVSWNTMQSINSMPQFTDFNGDGLEDLVEIRKTSHAVNKDFEYINTGSKQDLLSQITYPQGGNTTVNYKTTAQYTDGLGNPANKSPYLIFTVNKIITNDGLENDISSSYQYTGGHYYYNNPTDRKFAGYDLVAETDLAGNITKTYYHTANESDSARGEFQDNYFKIGKPYRIEKYDSAGNLYQAVVNKWDSYDLASGSKFVKLVQSVNYTFDGNATHRDTAESYIYDNSNGNLTQKIQWGEVAGQDNGTFSDIGQDKFTTNYTYANEAFSIKYQVSGAATFDQNGNKVKERLYHYDSLPLGILSKGNLTKQEDWKSGATYINNQKTYNSYGLMQSSTDPRGKITQYSYDAYNLYPAAVTNALNHVSQYKYDYSSGQITQKIDPNTRVFQYVYDGLGRLTEEKQPDLITPSTLVAKTTYVYTDTPNAVSVKKSDYLDGSNIVDSYVYFDFLGRKIQERAEAEDSNFTVKDYVYNSLGLLEKESLPYFSTGQIRTSPTGDYNLYTNYIYDPIGRIYKSTNSVGAVTNYYQDWKLIIYDVNNKIKYLYKDAYGNLIQVDEHNSGNIYSTFYNYNYLGNITKITDALGNIRSFTYDGLGQRLTAEDLHAPFDATFGVWKYGYDDAGNLTQKISPNNQTVNYTYDNINRQLTEDYTGSIGIDVVNTYDRGADGKGRLTGFSSSNLIQNNTYNALGFLKTESKIMSAVVGGYLTAYDYDRQGNQITIANPDNSQVKNIYNSAGLIDKIQRKERADVNFIDVVNNIDYSPTAEATVISYANGVVTSNNYDAAKLYRLNNKITAVAGGINGQNLSYIYDAIGNIVKIVDASDNIASKTSQYVYDDLYRLISANITNVAAGQSAYSQTFSYDAIGNILTKNETIGANPTIVYAYSYAGNTGNNYANPHALTSISNGASTTNFTYDNNGNMTTEIYSVGSQRDYKKSHTFDYNNRLVKSSIYNTAIPAGSAIITYGYDPSGQRIKYSNGATTTFYPTKFYNADSAAATPKITKHIFADSQDIATIEG
ncbi:MAG: VCBS repeat-containing protein, partial [Candidatus Staskawiczbacteria bacterium]|nr:VCBS repeat-containing protein [Candidatus Staskawiczbacteria bacterium]